MPGHPSKKHDQHLGFASLCQWRSCCGEDQPIGNDASAGGTFSGGEPELARHLSYKTAFKLACDGGVELIRIL